MIDKGVCDKEFIWNPSNCECECDKSCDIGEYLDYENCKCREKLVDKLVEECAENIEEAKIAEINLFEHKSVCRSSCQCTLPYFQQSLQSTLELLLILFTTNTWIVIKKTFLDMIISIKQQIININGIYQRN